MLKGMDFRGILKNKDKMSPVHECSSKSSPECQLTYIVFRHEQTMCLKCLVFNGLLAAHPLIRVEVPKKKKRK
jgi:hypothetical protein